MDEIISYKMCAVKVRKAKLRNYLKAVFQSSPLVLARSSSQRAASDCI
jgi:hypothetical protein